MSWERVKGVGIELEGGWGEQFFPELPFRDDISVPPPPGYMKGQHHWGEMVSPVLLPEEAEGWLRKYYPIHVPAPLNPGTESERSAGIHIHVSTHDELDYVRLAARRFYNHYLRGIREWGKVACPADELFFSRLEGKNRFAKRQYIPSWQIGKKHKDSNQNAKRRTLINYPHRLHGTVEFRLFPTFPSVEVAAGALRATLDLVHNYLVARSGEKEAEMEGCLRFEEVA